MRSSGRDLLHVPLALALGLLGAPACKDKPAVPPGPSGLPPLSAGTPAGDRSALVHAPEGGEGALPAGHPAMPEGHPAMPEGHPGTLAGHTPVPQTEDQPFRPPADASTRVRGVVKLSDKLKGKVAPGTTIFLMARPAVNGRPAPGMPLAVKRLEAGP